MPRVLELDEEWLIASVRTCVGLLREGRESGLETMQVTDMQAGKGREDVCLSIVGVPCKLVVHARL